MGFPILMILHLPGVWRGGGRAYSGSGIERWHGGCKLQNDCQPRSHSRTAGAAVCNQLHKLGGRHVIVFVVYIENPTLRIID